ncbi:MAG: CoA pyrophosphatase [Deltaproteobacteria bacterium]|nr:CoA pyrophosphatase [Deltaproteobacteria bacterium]
MMPEPDRIQERLGRFPVRELPLSGRNRASVLVPLFLKEGEGHLLFTRRADHLPHHRGEICFPGGERDPLDADAVATALRETEEEIGLAPGTVRILGRLDDVATRFHFHVVPIVGFFPYPAKFRVNRSEVAQLLEIPIRLVMDPSVFRCEKRLIDEQLLELCFFELPQGVIWGLTGAILRQFLDRALLPESG